LLGKLDAARQAGRFGEAEIALLKEKLAIVVSAFQSEREKREKELEALGSAARVELSEREYALSSARLELAEARSLIKILEAREDSTRDDLDEALTANEILKAQLMDEHECASTLRRECARFREALRDAGEALAYAAEKEEELASKPTGMDDVEVRLEREAQNAKIARLEEKLAETRDENKSLRRDLVERDGENSELHRAVAERDGAQRFLKSQLADWNQRLYARAEGSDSQLAGATSSASEGSASELRTRLDQVEIELGAKTGAVKALERRVREQDKALERARAEIEKMREKLFERDTTNVRAAAQPQRSKYVDHAEKTAAQVMETLRATRDRHAEKRGRDARAARRGGGAKSAQSRPAAKRERAPPSTVVIDASAPYQPPTADGKDEEDEDDDSEYEEVDVPIKRAKKRGMSKKKSIAPSAAKENDAADAAPANDGPRMPLGMLQMPTLGPKKDKGAADDVAQKKRRLNRQSAIPEALPSLMFGVADGDFQVAPAK